MKSRASVSTIGKDLGGQLVDAIWLEVGIERQRRVGEFPDALIDAKPEGFLGAFARNQRLLPFEPLHGLVEFEPEAFPDP